MSINSITQKPDPNLPSGLIITLRGEFEGLQQGWVVYTLRETAGETSSTVEKKGSKGPQPSPNRWIAQEATIESANTWESVIPVVDLSKKTRWYAVLARKFEVDGTCPPEPAICKPAGTIYDLEDYGLDSEYVEESSDAKELRIKGRS
ncbi:hypothetical protein ACIREE_30600 [Streptomyces sp. NPDC102467]|uniref:hypothetical protein n=1 Tax=Streptomyces sp. NPDC102467 TaxID=3366179 RepID=UPI0038141BEE